ncbi:MFS transporter [Pueribacillus theae]|uniref:MFS transporter n=1 Tax=Pueribacillus theae TaxID=2171751 RepID=A0A2U1K349_9BACI|nr:MFS transporter [Pueribacillus theae]PWA11936.1 MFS transporter [Pueribacillus theae]
MTKTYPKAWLLILTVGLGILLNPLNSSMISVALTQMQRDFSLTFADASWLISIFYLASAAGQPVMGKLSDMFGAKRLFLIGLILVGVSCSLAPFSPNYGFLLGCRALQAIGSSTLFPSGMSMIRSHITEKQARAISIVTIFSSTSAAFGPTIGGFLVAGWDWPAIFVINFPVIIAAILLAIFILPKDGEVNFEWKRIDFVGIMLFIISILGLILFLLSFTEKTRWWALMLFLVAGVIFYAFEKRRAEPFIDVVSLKKNINVTSVYLQFMLINFVYYNYFFGLPTLLQQVRGYSEEHAGLIMLALAGCSVLVTPLAGRMIDRNGSKLAMVIGSVILLIGTGLLLTYNENSLLIWLIMIMIVLGISNGFTNISAQTALYEHVDEEDTGAASGLFQTSRYLGSILSGSFLGMAFTGHLDDAHFHIVAIVSFVFCFVVAFISWKLPGKIKKPKQLR